ncbi:sigma-70 family RNA polymerase sigma factor [Nocardia shimofusensis]|uniref:sigma-70 family RNA polymerase sigma factor n=1 Tax=Nocardia shimofusensis TaxID=228596 RepID=UPI000832D8AD|nr:sigma-70 family RNA polymerase sigma factor [Nocardia shimofusensis]
MTGASPVRTLRDSFPERAERGFALSSDPLDSWLGAAWDDVPERLRPAVVEHVFGVDLTTMSTYAAAKARYVLERLDPDMRSDFEDIAQDALIQLTEILPGERIRHWKSVVLKHVQWQVLRERRRRTADKRHPGHRVDYESTVLVLEDHAQGETGNRLVDRTLLLNALDSIPHEETAAVMRATFVIAADGSYADIQTTREVAHDLRFSQEKVKRLRAQGARQLRAALRAHFDVRDGDGAGEAMSRTTDTEEAS